MADPSSLKAAHYRGFFAGWTAFERSWGGLDSATLDLVTRAARGSVLSKAMGKQGFYGQIDLPQDRAYEFAIALMASAAMTDDAQEGFAASLAKRPPQFSQRPQQP